MGPNTPSHPEKSPHNYQYQRAFEVANSEEGRLTASKRSHELERVGFMQSMGIEPLEKLKQLRHEFPVADEDMPAEQPARKYNIY